jgi:hypothetical protein
MRGGLLWQLSGGWNTREDVLNHPAARHVYVPERYL